MSISKRIWSVVRSNLNALLDEVAKKDDPLAELSDAELEAELARRRGARTQGRIEADRVAAERAARLKAAQEARARAAQERARQAAGSTGRASSSSSSSSGAGSSGRAGQAAARARGGDRVAALYATLETPAGSDLETTKKSFRRLMLKHHPDRFAGDAAKVRAATEKTKQLTQAWSELEKILVGKR